MLEKYIPRDSVQIVLNWINEYKFIFKITKSRSSKVGDYRPPFRGKPHRITVNHNLNKYAFLITLTHEVAHLTAWNKYNNKISPHGKEWKDEFKILLNQFLDLKIFPGDVLETLRIFLINPKAASCSDTNLVKILRRYNEASNFIPLEEISENTAFKLINGRTFIKGKQMRKRFICTETANKKKYLISPVAEVIPLPLY